MSYTYLASPYSHRNPTVRGARYHAALNATAALLKQRHWVYSPIVHCHALAYTHKLPTDAGFWREYNLIMLKPASGLIVLTIAGWDISLGVQGEIAFANTHSIPIKHLSPHNIAAGFAT